jgi:hypothetical protein
MEGLMILKHVVRLQYVPTTDNCPSHLHREKKIKKHL